MSNIFITKIGLNKELEFKSEAHKAMWHDFLKKNVGKEVRIELIKTKRRSLNQNNLYWFYLDLIEKETGNFANDLHEYFRRVFLLPKFKKIMGKEIKLPASTTELSKLEFGDYMMKICAETQVPIPDTETYLKYYEQAQLK